VHEVVFGVQDPSGARATATALVQILNVNRPPNFGLPPARQLIAGDAATIALVASDPDGQPLTFAIGELPAGAEFDPATGVQTWPPVAAQVGTYELPATVSDGTSSVAQVLSLAVSTVARGPAVHIERTPSFATAPGMAITVQVSA